MERRRYLGVLGTAALAGCSSIPFLNSKHQLGETVTFSEIEVTVKDAMTSRRVEVDRGQLRAPSNAVFALFEIRAHNTDITTRAAPVVNHANYETMRDREDVIELVGINDIRVYGSDEGGYLPEAVTDVVGYNQISVNDHRLATYPTGHNRPRLGATESVSGWVFGLIGRDQTPQLMIEFKGKSEMWTAQDADLSTPAPEIVI